MRSLCLIEDASHLKSVHHSVLISQSISEILVNQKSAISVNRSFSPNPNPPLSPYLMYVFVMLTSDHIYCMSSTCHSEKVLSFRDPLNYMFFELFTYICWLARPEVSRHLNFFHPFSRLHREQRGSRHIPIQRLIKSSSYNKCVFPLDGNISDLAILIESLFEVLSSGTSAKSSNVNLGVLRR